MIGSLQPLCVQSTEDPDGLETTLEDSETIRVNEIKMAMEEQQLSEQAHQTEMTLDERQQHSEDLSDGDPPVDVCYMDDEESDKDEEESDKVPNRKDLLNSSNLDESLVMVRSLSHLTSSLQEDDTTHMLTKIYHKFLELKKEKLIKIKLQANCHQQASETIS